MPKVFVGNISFTADESLMRDLFASFGPVAISKIIRERDSGRSLGFGWVELMDDEAAVSAAAALHGRDWMGRKIRTALMRPSDNRPRIA